MVEEKMDDSIVSTVSSLGVTTGILSNDHKFERWIESATVEQYRDLELAALARRGVFHSGRSPEQWTRRRRQALTALRAKRLHYARPPGGPQTSIQTTDEVVQRFESGSLFHEKDDTVFRQSILAQPSKINVPPRFPSPDEVRSEIRTKVAMIFKDYATLGSILDRHEGTIQKRWAKKTKCQRLKVLESAWPNMIKRHRLDIDAALEGMGSSNPTPWSAEPLHAFMWPNINQEDLLKPKILLLFLNARGRNGPWVFCELDAQSMSIGSKIGAIDSPKLNRHYMAFYNRTTSETYGELVAFHNREEVISLLRERGVPVGHGIQLLNMQQRMLRFLVDCCYQILQDIPPSELFDFPIQPEPTLTTEKSTAPGSLAVLTLEAPYKAPVSMDFGKLKSIFHAKRSAAEDHVWALREDPSYWEDALRDAMDHRYENVRDVRGRLHPNLAPGKEMHAWAPVISDVVASADYYLEAWSRLCEALSDIEDELEICGGTPTTGNPLPMAVVHRLSYFNSLLKQALYGPLAQLKAEFYPSPPWRPYAERHGKAIRAKTTPKTIKAIRVDGSPEERLQFIVCLLTEESEAGRVPAECWGYSIVVDELGRLLHNEPRANIMVSSRMANVISDLSVITEAMRQLIYYSGNLSDVPVVPLSPGSEKIMQELKLPYGNLLQEIEGSEPKEIYQLGLPTNKRFHFPSEKRRTKENHEAMRSAEANLDAFWRKVDANLESTRKWHSKHDGAEGAMYKLLSQPRFLQRTGPWVDPSATKLQNEQVKHAETQRPLSEMYFDLEHRTEHTLLRPENHRQANSPTKRKTRGRPSSHNEENPTSREPTLTNASERSDEQKLFALDVRSLKVFKTIFFDPNSSATPGEVPWLDFVHAMVATGFDANKLYGSVWNFSPTQLDVERSIQIHEPHPSGKIPYRVCRRHGRRLNRAYGWTGENFVLAKKNGQSLRERQSD